MIAVECPKCGAECIDTFDESGECECHECKCSFGWELDYTITTYAHDDDDEEQDDA